LLTFYTMLRGICLLAATLFLSLTAGAAELSFDFTTTPVGKTPEGLRPMLIGSGPEPVWQVLQVDAPSAFAPLTSKGSSVTKAAVLAQTSTDGTDERFPIILNEGDYFGDFTFTTKFKLVSGTKERMAGIVFRAQDQYNFYVVRASGLGNTFRFYKVVGGIRQPPIGPEINIPSGVWHEMSVQCEANKIRCFLNGKQVIPELTDNTFINGKVGFWTKSDSVSYFTQAKVTFTPREIYAQKVVNLLMERFPRTLAVKIYGPKVGSTNIVLLASNAKISETEIAEDSSVAGTAIAANTPMLYSSKTIVKVTMPVHDRNGDPMAAVRVELDPFFGQTEQTSLTRAMVYKQEIEARVKNLKEFFE
jgi:hypothetical protein